MYVLSVYFTKFEMISEVCSQANFKVNLSKLKFSRTNYFVLCADDDDDDDVVLNTIILNHAQYVGKYVKLIRMNHSFVLTSWQPLPPPSQSK